MQTPLIALSLAGSGPVPRVWTSNGQLRIGRLPELEVSVDDLSVSRLHAEISLSDGVWVVRDRGSSNGTILNSVRIGRTPQPLQQGDTIQVGNLVFQVTQLQVRPITVRLGQQTVQIEATARRTFVEADDAGEPPGATAAGDNRGMLRLIRNAHRLAHPGQTGDMLQAIISDAAAHFDARRAGVFLLDDATGQFGMQCFTVRGGGGVSPPRPPGKTLATLAFRRRQSLLFKNGEEAAEHACDSVLRNDMNSVICAVLRAPDREMGVLHFDRGSSQEPFSEADLYQADSLATSIALGLDRHQLVASHEVLFLQTVTALSQAVEMRDPYTGNHTQRVTAYALLLAEELGLGETDRRQLRIATLLHDIGKIAIDDQILRKPGRLSDAEFETMRSHVVRGWEIVQMIPGLASALPVVRGHHERWDGRGYPDGLAGEDIPLTARVVAVADAFDAMTSDRPYRAGMPAARAFAELEAGAGSHFDPTCVAAFLRARPRVEEVMAREAAERQSAEASRHTVSRQELDRERKAAQAANPNQSGITNALSEPVAAE